MKKKLGEILIEKGLITSEQLNSALYEQARNNEFLGKILLNKQQITELDLLTVLAKQFNIPIMSLKDKHIDWDLIKSFGASLLFDYSCFALKKDDSSVTVAITNPLDAWALKKIEEEAMGLKVKLVLVFQADILDVVARYRKHLSNNIDKLL